MRRLLLGLAAVTVTLAVVVGPWDVDAQESVDVGVTEIGWWSSRPTALAQPEGGFEVSAGPTGEAQSVAALRLSIAATKVDSLQVRFAEAASIGTELGILRLCTTTAPWTAANPGAMDAAPQPDCSLAVGMTRTTDGVWLADAAALVPNGGEVSLMVVPLYQSPITLGPGMVVTISGGELTATGANTAATTTTTVFDTGGGGSSFDDSTTDYFGPTGGGSFGVPAFGGTADFGSVPTGEPAAPADTGDGDESDDFALTPIQNEGGPATPWIRLVPLVPLCVGFGVGSVRLRRLLHERLGWAL